ncbi:MAG: outer membrane protein assembly factor BamD [Brachymonas sp.]|nr:outer membrane protein assembly factor BamD [Brachymonas sp.]
MQTPRGAASLSGVFAALLAGAVLVAGCSTQQRTAQQQTAGWSNNRLYSEARDERNSGSYDRAVELYNVLEGRAAGTTLAQQAQLEKAYAYYQNGDPGPALATLDRFIQLNPASPALDYAYYLKGVVHFSESSGGWLSFLTKQEIAERDQRAAKASFDAFKELITRFPESRYASDARRRMVYIANAMSESELAIATYYYKQGAYVAAINRAQSTVSNYDGTPSQEKALAILAQSYAALGLDQPRDDTLRVLETNFPESPYLKQNYSGKPKSWWQLW